MNGFALRLPVLVALAAVLPRGEPEVEEVRARHPWARFAPGSWVMTRDTNDYVMEGEKGQDVSTSKQTLKAVTESEFTLVREGDELGDAVIDEVTQRFTDESPWVVPIPADAAVETLTVDAREIACRLVHFEVQVEQFGTRLDLEGDAWWSDAHPMPLRVRLSVEAADEVQAFEMVAEKLDVEIAVGERKVRCMEIVRRGLERGESGELEPAPDETSTSRAWFSAEVPGLLVKSVEEHETAEGTFGSVTEVVDFFVRAPSDVTRVEEPPLAPARPTGGACEVVARFVDAEGEPIAGAQASLRGRSHDREELAKAGVVPDWNDLEAKTDAEGRLSLSFVPPRSFEFFFEVKAPGLAKATWRWRELAVGSRMDLGEIRLEPSATIVGTLRDSEGRAVPGGYYVMARLQEDDESKRGRDRESVYEYGVPVNGSDEYRVENIPAGTYEVMPYLNAAGWADAANVTVKVVAGEETRVDLRYSGPDLARRIRVITFVEPFYSLKPTLDRVRLVASDGTERRAVDGGVQSFDFNDVADGSYTLVIDDPRFEAVRREGLRPGSRIDVRMRGSAALQVIASDSDGGAAITELAVSQEQKRSKSWPRRFPLRLIGGEPLIEGLVRGALPGDSTVYVSASGYGEVALDVDDLASGETRALAVVLTRAAASETADASASIAGVVRDAQSGEPVAGVEVKARRSGDGFESREATTDEQGRFHLAALEPGQWSVQATRSVTIESQRHRLQLKAGHDRADLVLKLASGVEASGRLDGLHGFPEAVRLVFARVDPEDPGQRVRPDRFAWFRAQRAELAADGKYVARDLAPGRYRAGLQIEGGPVTIGPSHTMHTPERCLLLGEVELVAARENRFDFDASALRPGSILLRVASAGTSPTAWLAIARTADAPPPASGDDEGGVNLAELLGEEDDDADEEDGGAFGSIDGFSFDAFDDINGDLPGALANVANDGTARLATLPAGNWIVGVRARGGAWSVESERPIALAIGETRECDLAVALTTAKVTLIDAVTGERLANERVRWLHSSASRTTGLTAETDADGCLELTLPDGRVQFWDLGTSRSKKDDPALAAPVAWPPPEGTVSVRRRPAR